MQIRSGSVAVPGRGRAFRLTAAQVEAARKLTPAANPLTNRSSIRSGARGELVGQRMAVPGRLALETTTADLSCFRMWAGTIEH